MKKILYILIALLLLSPTIVFGAVTFPVNGGTGSTTLSGILIGNGTAPVNTLIIGSNLTLSGTTLSASGGGSSFGYPFPSNATSTLLTFSGGATIGSNLILSALGAGTLNSTSGGNVYSTATSSLSVGSPLTVTGTFGALIGGTNSTINCQTASGSQAGCLSSTDWSTFNGKQASGNYITALTGDVTASGPGSAVSTLATVNANTGTFGSSTAIPVITSNGKGLTTGASTVAVIAPAGTLSGTTLNSSVVTSSLTSANLATLTATDGSLIFSGSFNGNTARTVGLNVGNSNTWSVLQNFSNASTSQLSVFNKTYFGGTATTTIDSTGNIVIPNSSNLTITGKSDGCATFATGVLNSTGIACGSGGSLTGTTGQVPYFSGTNTAVGTSSVFIAPTQFVGIGTSSPVAQLHVDSDNANSVAEIIQGFSGQSSDLLQVKNDTGTNFLTVNSAGALNLYQQAQFTGPTFGQFQETTANAGLDFKTVAGTGDITFTPNAVQALNLNHTGNIGVASSTPWALLSVNPTSAVNTSPYFAIGSSTQTNVLVDNAGNMELGTSSALGKQLYVFGNQSGGIMTINRFNAVTTGVLGTQTIQATSLGTMTNGFGVSQTYVIQGAGTTANTIADIRAYRSQVDNSGELQLFAYNGGATDSFSSIAMDGNFHSAGVGTSSPQATWSIKGDAASGNTRSLIVTDSNNKESLTVNNSGLVAIGTSTPYAIFSIQSNTSTGDIFTLATSSTHAIAGWDNSGHRFTSGPTPAVSSCGTGSPTVVGDDQGGTITTGSAASACTLTFAKAYAGTPYCTESDSSTASTGDISSISTTAVTFSFSVGLTSGSIYYQCNYHK